MPHLSPPTLTHGEQKAILRATLSNPRDHLIYSLALGTGLRLANERCRTSAAVAVIARRSRCG